MDLIRKPEKKSWAEVKAFSAKQNQMANCSTEENKELMMNSPTFS
jgi:hypothetical protein